MKIFIDIGASDGDTLDIAYKKMFTDFDAYYGFEPFKKTFDKMMARYENNSKFHLYQVGVDVEDKKNVKLYLHKSLKDKEDYARASSMFDKKWNIDRENYELINTIDFSKFIRNNFKEDDYIVLKINAEGIEYPLLNYMVDNDTIDYIDVIYCDWHYKKIGYPQSKHNKIVEKIRKRKIKLFTITDFLNLK